MSPPVVLPGNGALIGELPNPVLFNVPNYDGNQRRYNSSGHLRPPARTNPHRRECDGLGIPALDGDSQEPDHNQVDSDKQQNSNGHGCLQGLLESRTRLGAQSSCEPDAIRPTCRPPTSVLTQRMACCRQRGVTWGVGQSSAPGFQTSHRREIDDAPKTETASPERARRFPIPRLTGQEPRKGGAVRGPQSQPISITTATRPKGSVPFELLPSGGGSGCRSGNNIDGRGRRWRWSRNVNRWPFRGNGSPGMPAECKDEDGKYGNHSHQYPDDSSATAIGNNGRVTVTHENTPS